LAPKRLFQAKAVLKWAGKKQPYLKRAVFVSKNGPQKGTKLLEPKQPYFKKAVSESKNGPQKGPKQPQ
jgi:hypothetical protein